MDYGYRDIPGDIEEKDLYFPGIFFIFQKIIFLNENISFFPCIIFRNCIECLQEETGMLTEFGEFLKILMIGKGNITQDALGKDIGCSASQISKIITGKKSPDLDFLIKCKEYFGLDKQTTVDFFRAALSSSTVITLDMSYFSGRNKKWLIDTLPTFLLFPERQYCTGDELALEGAIETIKRVLTEADTLNPLRKDNEKD
jgi:plasmid maintenance system antidote protein VapI